MTPDQQTVDPRSTLDRRTDCICAALKLLKYIEVPDTVILCILRLLRSKGFIHSFCISGNRICYRIAREATYYTIDLG